MKPQTTCKIIFLSMLLTSCGFFDRWKTPEQPTDSKDTSYSSSDVQMKDDFEGEDLFKATQDDPTAISDLDSELDSLDDEFHAHDEVSAPIIAKEETLPKETEVIPEIKANVSEYESSAGQIKTYKVKRGDTLMQIAFKIYGDISMWKELRSLNASTISSNASLKENTEIKYRSPERTFVWNPTGTAYLIKTGDTLGTISNDVYGTNTKWRAIWNNNKPLIKNPNVIFAGFTLYYPGSVAEMTTPEAPVYYVTQEPAVQPVMEQAPIERIQPVQEVQEEVITHSTTPEKSHNEIQAELNEIEAADDALSYHDEAQELDEAMDEATEAMAAPVRSQMGVQTKNASAVMDENEIDLINNLTGTTHVNEYAPDIDEEVQILE